MLLTLDLGVCTVAPPEYINQNLNNGLRFLFCICPLFSLLTNDGLANLFSLLATLVKINQFGKNNYLALTTLANGC